MYAKDLTTITSCGLNLSTPSTKSDLWISTLNSVMNYDLYVSPFKVQLWPLFSEITAKSLTLCRCCDTDLKKLVNKYKQYTENKKQTNNFKTVLSASTTSFTFLCNTISLQYHKQDAKGFH